MLPAAGVRSDENAATAGSGGGSIKTERRGWHACRAAEPRRPGGLLCEQLRLEPRRFSSRCPLNLRGGRDFEALNQKLAL